MKNKKPILIKLSLDEKKAEELGNRIIELFQLKKKTNGRFELAGGDKTPLGIGRTMEYLIERLKIENKS